MWIRKRYLCQGSRYPGWHWNRASPEQRLKRRHLRSDCFIDKFWNSKPFRNLDWRWWPFANPQPTHEHPTKLHCLRRDFELVIPMFERSKIIQVVVITSPVIESTDRCPQNKVSKLTLALSHCSFLASSQSPFCALLYDAVSTQTRI
jgi:hypothetical protein